MRTLAIFASGRGSNAEAIIKRFSSEQELEVGLIVTNRANAGVIELAKTHEIPYHVTNRTEFSSTESILHVLKKHQIDFIALAGFLWLVPEPILRDYAGKIVNIHPALLPKYGGKGMYGIKVHEAVHAAAELESGITIHFVDEQYDRGTQILQVKVALDAHDNPITIANKVLVLEHRYYPEILVELLMSLESV